MKIGELAARCHVSRDTIRYYVELELLLPSREKAQMDFGERELSDLRYIQKLKQMHFQLREIQSIISLRRMSHLADASAQKAYRKILLNKQEALKEEAQALSETQQMLAEMIANLPREQRELGNTCGVPLCALPLLRCPDCRKALAVCNASIFNNEVMDGELVCSCGYRAKIEDGIVLTQNRYLGAYDRPDLKRGLYRNVGDRFAACFQRASDKVASALNVIEEKQKNGLVVMETNINGYFFLFDYFHKCNPDNLYIITDRYPEMLRMYKDLIERREKALKILFIADDSLHFPLAENCADVIIDFFASNEQFLYKKEPYVAAHLPYLRPSGELLGTLFGFDSNSKSVQNVPLKYPECAPNALDYKAMLKSCRTPGRQLQTELIGTVEETYDQYSFACHVTGENLSVCFYHLFPETSVQENGNVREKTGAEVGRETRR